MRERGAAVVTRIHFKRFLSLLVTVLKGALSRYRQRLVTSGWRCGMGPEHSGQVNTDLDHIVEIELLSAVLRSFQMLA